MSRAIKMLLAGVLVAGLVFGPAPGGATSDTPEPNAQTLQQFINDLEKAIGNADQRMVAHPSFLDELRTLVQRYQDKIRQVFFSDDFSDGDYAYSPKWVVDKGFFFFFPDRRLRSQVKFKPTPPKQKQEKDAGQEVFNMILKGVLDAATDNQTSQEPASTQSQKEYQQAAVIKAKTSIGAAFEVDLSFVAEPSQGAMEIALMGGNPARNLYRLVYNASPSQDRPIQIIREKGGRSYVIDTATEYPMLEDGALHQIQWIRDMNGNMSVMVDGRTVISTVELMYRDPFSGFSLANLGGTYEWDSIKILQPITQ